MGTKGGGVDEVDIKLAALERTLAIFAKEGRFANISHLPEGVKDSGRLQVGPGTYVNPKRQKELGMY